MHTMLVTIYQGRNKKYKVIYVRDNASNWYLQCTKLNMFLKIFTDLSMHCCSIQSYVVSLNNAWISLQIQFYIHVACCWWQISENFFFNKKNKINKKNIYKNK